jgi:Ras-related protein Rab-6A
MGARHKVVVIGNTAVGKTSLINQFVYGTVSAQHQPTVGIDFFSKVVTVEEQAVHLQLWDTAGQERFHALIPSYIRNSTVALLVYDITNRETFDALKQWHKTITDLAAPALIVVGNKVDLKATRAVSADEARPYAESVGAPYFETSAITPLNIQELFMAVAHIPIPQAPEGSVEAQPVVEKVNLDAVVQPKTSRVCC